MDTNVLSVLLSIAFGAVGYLSVTFFFQPILRYRELKSKIISDLIYFANINDVEPKDLEINEVLRERYWKRSETIRRNATDLRAFYYFLPKPYRKLLQLRKQYPIKASDYLMLLSNITKSEDVSRFKEQVLTLLKLKGEAEAGR